MAVKTHMSRSLRVALCNSFDKMCKPQNFQKKFQSAGRMRQSSMRGLGTTPWSATSVLSAVLERSARTEFVTRFGI